MKKSLYEYIVRNSNENCENKDVIQFGIQMFQMLSVSMMVALAIALCMKMLAEAVVFLLVLIPLRQNAGGYHAKHKTTCAIMSMLIYICSLIIIKYYGINSMVQLFLCLIDSYVIMYFSPVENINNELDDKEREVYKNRTRNILIFELLIYMLLFVSYKQYWSGIIIMSITVVSVLVYIGYLQNNIINKR